MTLVSRDDIALAFIDGAESRKPPLARNLCAGALPLRVLSVGGGMLVQGAQPLTDLPSRLFELARLANATCAPQLMSVLEKFLVTLRAFDLQPKALVGTHPGIVRWDCCGQD